MFFNCLFSNLIGNAVEEGKRRGRGRRRRGRRGGVLNSKQGLGKHDPLSTLHSILHIYLSIILFHFIQIISFIFNTLNRKRFSD